MPPPVGALRRADPFAYLQMRQTAREPDIAPMSSRQSITAALLKHQEGTPGALDDLFDHLASPSDAWTGGGSPRSHTPDL